MSGGSDASFTERYFDAMAAADAPRARVAGVIRREGRLLVQRPTDPRGAFYAFPGGRYERGDSFVERLARELEEEMGARLTSARYGFVVENRIRWKDGLAHFLEHFLFAEIAPGEVVSREPHLSFHWLEPAELATADLRPRPVRDALAQGRAEDLRHLVV